MKTKYRILPIFSDLILAAFSACDGILFDTHTNCPHCGGSLIRYDVKKKRFADIIEGSSHKIITVLVKRFRCRVCHAVVYADQPFYPNTRIGSPVVDLCITLRARMTYGRASTYLEHIGVKVDRWSVRNYAMKNLVQVPSTEKYGIMLPVSIISLTAITSNIGNGTSITASEVLSACGYPSSQKPGAALKKP